MNSDIQPGHYVVAVSGGVDSVVLLDVLHRLGRLQLTVAHYDHGIRAESNSDQRFVKQLAAKYGLPYIFAEDNLGSKASEATARQARYKFLHNVRRTSGARAVVTAHHQDDLIETALLHTWRGTGRKGLTALQSTDIVKRPLLHIPKQQLYYYARNRDLSWREDSTNTDQRYRRNELRHHLQRKLTPAQRTAILKHIDRMQHINQEIDMILANHLHLQPHTTKLDRQFFNNLDHQVALEFLAAWLRRHNIRNFDRTGLGRMVVAAKTYAANRQIDVNAQSIIKVDRRHLALAQRDR